LLAGGDGDLVLHLGQAEISDATGLGVLVGLHQRARRSGRRLVIAEASERLERLLRLTKLHLVLARVDSASALSAYPGPVPGVQLPSVPPTAMR
jgi:anti-anti-sigma factor